MSVLAIIPARSGSRRLSGKNLRNFCGKPLLQWTVEQACRIKEIGRVVVTTDIPITKVFGQVMCRPKGDYLPRPRWLCGDDVPMAHVIAHVLGQEEKWPDLVVLLQPTSPTRTDETIRECLRVAEGEKEGFRFETQTVDAFGNPTGACYVFRPNHLPPFGGHRQVKAVDVDINTIFDFERAEASMWERLARERA